MKKIFSFLFTVIFLLSFSAIAFAAPEREYNWSEIESVSALMGEDAIVWKIDEVEAGLVLPYAFSPVKLSDEDAADGCIGIAVSEDNNDEFILFYYLDAGGVTLDSLYSYFNQNGTPAEIISTNGIPALLQRNEANNSLSLTYFTQENKLFQVIFSPLSGEESLFRYVIASIRPLSEYEEEKAAVTDEVLPATSVNPVSGLISK